MTEYANPLSRLASRMRPNLCVRTTLHSGKTTFTAIPEWHDRSRIMQLLTSSYRQCRPSLAPDSITKPGNTIQYP
jgi:hypothetical protein